ncbi:MAG: 6,7-dimethyl-8-ribityllumazine synthase [Candidatus Rokubacteria bacterium]|nr:6,7-dimethyl-8-ribityllumazine synthase [Candidatus Rokubacteria bacterium]
MAGRAPGAPGELSARGYRFAIIASRFHEEIAKRLVEGARETLRRHGVADKDALVVWVPGAFEIPPVALAVARRGDVDALVCVGCVIRGETPHFEYVAGEAARGIADVGRLTGIPTTFGVITAETVDQAFDRAGGRVGNRGEEAALAAIELVALLRALSGRAGGRRRSSPARRRGRSLRRKANGRDREPGTRLGGPAEGGKAPLRR